MKYSRCVFQLAGLILSGLALASCGSGGSNDGETTPTIAAPTHTLVSGTVMAPGGAIAFFKQPSLGDVFVSEAYAALTGLANVPDNTIVQLARLDANAANVSVVTTTTTSGGRYSFDLTELGLQPSNDLIVRIEGSGGKQMRAFVVGSVADISPVSEAAYQLAIQSLNGRLLSNLTLQEVADISGAVGLISMLQNIGTATSVDQAVGLVKTAVGANAQVTGFITAAAIAGQTPQGTGDVGNFYPFQQGNIWRYSGVRAVSGPTIAYDNTVLVSGQGPAPIHGVNSTIFTETNDEGEGRAEKSYGVKGLSGITSYGNDDPNDNTSRQLAPFQAVHFPLTLWATTILAERGGLDWGDDEDGDGRNETFNIKLFQTVLGTESVTVPAGTFPIALKVEQKAVFIVMFTTGGNATLIQTNTGWHVSGVGAIKELVQAQVEGGPVSTFLTEELLGYVVNGQGSGLRIEVVPASVSIRVGEQKTLRATAFDQFNSQVVGLPLTWISTTPSAATIDPDGTLLGKSIGTTNVSASLGGLKSNVVTVTVSDVRILNLSTNDLAYDKVSGKLYASVPGIQGRIVTIDPVTGTMGPSVTGGNEPNKLAISDNGQFLYVSLDNESSIRRFTLPALVPDLTFSMGALPPSTPQEFICGKDIEVIPGNPRGVVVARAKHLGSGSCNFNEPYEVAVFQDGVELPNKYTGQAGAVVHLVEFSDSADLLFGLGTFSPGTIVRLSVTPSGLSFMDFAWLSNWPGRDFNHSNGLIYTASGDAIDPSNYRIVGSFTRDGNPGGGSTLRPDLSTRRMFFINGGINDSTATLYAFDMNTFSPIGSVDIPNLSNPAIPQFTRYTSLVRWGLTGLAFRTSSNEVVIIRSPLVGS
jgi:hypothetical protein